MTTDLSTPASSQPPEDIPVVPSLSPEGARIISTTVKSEPQMRDLTSRWLLKVLPWREAVAGVYQLNIHDDDHPVQVTGDHQHGQTLPRTHVEYDRDPDVYPLQKVRAILGVDSEVDDLYNVPFNQTHQQLRLVRAVLRERQEYEMVNNDSYGLLANVHRSQRLHAREGVPTPDDMDNLISRRRRTKAILAHPRTIGAFGHECNRRGVYPDMVEIEGHHIAAWRGVPIFPCNKLLVDENNASSVLALRLGEEDEGVFGLHQTGIPDEVEPSMNARFMGIDAVGTISYLVTAYFNVIAMLPDSYGVLHVPDVRALEDEDAEQDLPPDHAPVGSPAATDGE
jgi:hypothetical protein